MYVCELKCIFEECLFCSSLRRGSLQLLNWSQFGGRAVRGGVWWEGLSAAVLVGGAARGCVWWEGLPEGVFGGRDCQRVCLVGGAVKGCVP